MLKCKAGLQANESWSKDKFTAIVLIKANFYFAHPFCAAWQISFELHLLYQCWSYWIYILSYLGSVRKILDPPYCIHFRCSKFKQMFRISFHFTFHLSFKTQVSSLTEFSLICFSNEDLKTLHQQLYWDNWNVCIISFNYCERAQLAWK